MSEDSIFGRLRSAAERLRQNRLVRGVALLSGGTALGQVLVAASSLAITRLYVPAELGVLAIYASVLGIAGAASSLRYDFAATLPEDEDDGLHVLAAAACALVLVTVLVTGGVEGAFALEIVPVALHPLEPYTWLVPVGMLSIGCYRLLNYWGIRVRAYGRIARTKLSQSVGQVATQVGLGLLGWGPLGLMAGQVVGQAAGITTLAKLMQGKHLRGRLRGRRMWHLVKRYRRLATYGTGGTLLNSAGIYLPALLVAGLYGTHVAGLFALTERVVKLPVTLVGTATAQVYLGEATELARSQPERLRRLYWKAGARLALIGLVPAAVLLLTGPALFTFVFGDAWTTSGRFAQVLAVMLLARLVCNPLMQTLSVVGREHWQAAWEAVRLIGVAAALVAAHAAGASAVQAVAAYGVVGALAYAAAVALGWIALRRSDTPKAALAEAESS